jgi:hypothetical protein
MIAPIFSKTTLMTELSCNEEPSTLYAKLLGETATIGWTELQPFFARGALLWVDPGLDLIAAAQAIALDDHQAMAAWLEAGVVEKLNEARAIDLLERDPVLWAVVVSPWVVVQERALSDSSAPK